MSVASSLFATAGLTCALALFGCDAIVDVDGDIDPDCSQSGSADSQSCIVPEPHIPYVAGGWTRVYVPSGTRYLNDHSLIRGPNGTWHLYGITHESAGEPHSEIALLHASASTLWGPWKTELDVLTSDPAANEGVLWAPYVFERAAGRWTMYYTSPSITGQDQRVIRRADSEDLTRWSRADPSQPSGRRPPGGRDTFVLQVGNEWWLYSVGVDPSFHGQIVVSRSADLTDWSEPVAVITDPVPSFGWGNLESPFVVFYKGYYYLFLTRTGGGHTDYARTNVFRSSDPGRFSWAPITDIRAHAAEIVYDDGYFMTSAGWTFEVGEENRGLLMARLRWAPDIAAE